MQQPESGHEAITAALASALPVEVDDLWSVADEVLAALRSLSLDDRLAVVGLVRAAPVSKTGLYVREPKR